MPATLTSGSAGVAALTSAGAIFCRMKPAASGTRITFTIDMNMLQASTGRYWLANVQTRKGVTTDASSVVTLVTVTLSGTSPLAR
jgi:hypothetical protein